MAQFVYCLPTVIMGWVAPSYSLSAWEMEAEKRRNSKPEEKSAWKLKFCGEKQGNPHENEQIDQSNKKSQWKVTPAHETKTDEFQMCRTRRR